MSPLFIAILICKLIYDGIATIISYKIARSKNPYREYYNHFAEKVKDVKDKQEDEQNESVR